MLVHILSALPPKMAHGPADIDPADGSEGDPGAPVIDTRRQPDALSEPMTRAGIDDAQLGTPIQGGSRLHQSVDDLLDRPVASHGDDEPGPLVGRFPGGRGRFVRPLRHAEREFSTEMALDGGEYSGLAAARPSRGRSRIENNVSPSFAHIRFPLDLRVDMDIGAWTRGVVRKMSRTCQEMGCSSAKGPRRQAAT